MYLTTFHCSTKTTEVNGKRNWTVNISLYFLSLSKSSSLVPTSTPLAHFSSNAYTTSSASSTSSSLSDLGTDGTVRHPHPEALKAYLESSFPSHYSYPNPNEYSMIVQLAGDFVGILLSCKHHRQDIDTTLASESGGGLGRKRDWFCLWDWVKGECLVVSLGSYLIYSP